MSTGHGHGMAFALLLLYSPCAGSGRTDRNPTTHLELSDGLRDGATVCFLVDHVLTLPGRLIVPMYVVATPAKVLAEGLWLYCYDESTGAVRQIVRLSTSSSGGRRGNVRNARIARDGTRIVLRYETGWSRDRKEVSHGVAVFDTSTGHAAVVSPEGEAGALEALSGYESPSTANSGIVSAEDIRALTCALPYGAWGLPSPLAFDRRSTPALLRLLVGNEGDRYLHTAIFEERIKGRMKADEVLRLVSTMKRRLDALKGTRKTYYAPYYEEWSARLRMAAGGVGCTPLMRAAHSNAVAEVSSLLDGGAVIDAPDENGCTPLMYAIFGVAPDATALLLGRGADTRLTAASGWTAWMFASHTPLRRAMLRL